MVKLKINKNQKIVLLTLFVILIVGGGYYFFVTKNNNIYQSAGQENKGLTKEEVLEKSEKNKPKKTEPEIKQPQSEGDISDDEKKVRVVVQDFETAYKNKDKTKIFTSFTDPITDQDKDTKSRLLNGGEGGPTLFETTNASEYPLSFEIVEVNIVAKNYVVKVKEKRSGDFVRERNITLIGTNGKWLIDKYESQDYTGKYTGFLNFY